MKAAVSPTGGTTTGYRTALNRAQRKRIAGTLASFAVLLLGWQLFPLTQPSYVFPSLPHIVRDMASFASDGTLWRATWATLQSVVAGSIASLIVGTLAGFALKRHESFFGPLLNFAQTVPYVVWALMSMIWFGLSQLSVIFTIFIAGFTIIAYNVSAGLHQVDRQLLEMAESVSASRVMTFRHITLPSLTPYLVSGSRTMIAICWKIVVLAELFAGGAGGGGIGYNLYVGWEFNRTNEVFAWTVWLVILMLLTDWLVIAPIDRFATRWKRG
ncbi:MAG: ABC transporter, permease protein (cluster 10, nitrate/sulfonate/bicarbonate) [uncultured Paraburkholderia sp.]|uniref:ABC transporter permease n=1 Tax=uncultured Paraburkholderia sp. TaxID=1822466 RepID=UPI002598233A|nr:ABC transporter permease subunit [uncultured Paraburkholderia sp.]CAH2894431.1 MAG: ABC transporter, permease protein (cluster 10, nitrate/sulfonate/bicarbonate) [uncultured Paraburkholderia sp.]CAH2910929.1 MAG: ABC transporter, permease protein (cluster 10, nitrate/sulfonate/bicarbonate) [uncultured Paraburkholderia sp.]